LHGIDDFAVPRPRSTIRGVVGGTSIESVGASAIDFITNFISREGGSNVECSTRRIAIISRISEPVEIQKQLV